MGNLTPQRTAGMGERRYVEVIASTSPEGVITPLEIVWETGRHYPIERILDRRLAQSLKSGGEGVRFTVRIGRHDRHLWYQEPRWFVEVPRRISA